MAKEHKMTFGDVAEKLPQHPGSLMLKVIKGQGLSVYAAASKIGANRQMLNYVVKCERPVSNDIAAKFAAYFSEYTEDELLLFQLRFNQYKYHSKQKLQAKKDITERKSEDVPPHPGSIIKKELIDAASTNVHAVALQIDICQQTLDDLTKEKAPLSPRVAIKLSNIFSKYTAEELMGFQTRFNLYKEKQAMLKKPHHHHKGRKVKNAEESLAL